MRLLPVHAISSALPALALSSALLTAQSVAPGPTDIAGTVRGPRGPEAGVWVIAETKELPTHFVRIVVTDDSGRYLIPDLPRAAYDVWVRGYGLVDSRKVRARIGTVVNVQATPAPDARSAARIYPAGYWLSMLKVPAETEFPGTGAAGNGIAPTMKSQQDWIRTVKSGGCTACHQLGTLGTRVVPEAYRAMGPAAAQWERRVQSGQAGPQMLATIDGMGHQRALQLFGEWTDRIAAGEVPATSPTRPRGIERNVVITEWDWADPKAYMHDLVSTDRRDPTVNAWGKMYGALELSADYLPVLDPKANAIDRVPLTVRDPATEPATGPHRGASSVYWGDEAIWTSKNNVHNPMMDEKGRVWITSAIRPPENPAFCKAGSTHPSAKLFPLNRSGRQLAMYDPTTKKLTHINTCFGTHHLMFAEDPQRTLWTSGGGPVIGWLDTKLFEQTGDEERAQGWTALILDTNGDGKRGPYTEPNEPIDPTKDHRITAGFYAVSPAPDGSVWGSSLGYPGGILRLVPGAHPPETALVEYFEPPFNSADPAKRGYSPRGMDIDRNGVAWVALASGHLASFDRRKCTGPLNGPTATGQHCPEGWTLYPEPLPQLSNVTASGSAEASYYTWVDQHDALGLGKNTPINTGNASEGLLALKDGQWVVLRVPYPTGFYTKWMDGRIDDARAGWKGRGLWATVSTRAPFHMETGKGTTAKAVHFQMRPSPLAR
ncbi:MAG: carboxypeptidase regulatory-like domain-containing protein [Gemmatimonadetes bacterium]|nr:carboxypeptidase regulatory-like domain-containing protein [Gemmatimonadota bacterium]